MEPPVRPFKNTPTPTPKQCKHVKAAAQDAAQVSKKIQDLSLTRKYKVEQFSNGASASGDILYFKFWQNNGMETCRYVLRSLAV